MYAYVRKYKCLTDIKKSIKKSKVLLMFYKEERLNVKG